MFKQSLAVFMALVVLCGGIVGCGGVEVKNYTKQDVPWGLLERVAVLPFNLPSENPVRRRLVTQLFAEQLRSQGMAGVSEVPISSPVAGVSDLKQIARDYEVDAVFVGSIDEVSGTVIHVRLQDAATAEVLWSSTYLLSARSEFFSMKNQQQQFQRAFERLVEDFMAAKGSAG